MRLYQQGSDLLSQKALTALYMPSGDRSLRLSFVASLDGAVTAHGRGSAPLSNEADLRILKLLRDLSDAVLVGAGTLRDENYGPMTLNPQRRAARIARGHTEYPPLVVATRSARLDPSHPALAEAPVRPLIVTCEKANSAHLAEVADVLMAGEDTVDWHVALQMLTARGLSHILCEGGPQLAATLVEDDLVDELCLTFSPQLVGAPLTLTGHSPLTATHRMHLAHLLGDDDTVLTRYVRRPQPTKV